ncbi:MAG: radical SAM family heme chaperone HemW [Nitrospirota bacterium]
MASFLYINIPFCIRKCIYCDFLSVPFDEALARRYTDAIIQELTLRKDLLDELRSVYIGGGTPTTLPVTEYIRLFGFLKKQIEISPDAEITIEANPGTINDIQIKTLSDLGINRFSIGVQSFINRELQLLGRIHNSDNAVKAIDIIRSSGIRNLSIDLIYGIPGQSFDDWEVNLSRAAEISPEHISAYELTPEKDTPLDELISQGTLEKPDEETIINMYFNTIDRLKKAGHRHYEISNYSKPGFECRHNLNYWNRGEYIGIGAGAHSFIRDRRIKNTHNIEQYIKSINDGTLAIDEDIEVSCEDALREFIFLGMRKTEGLNIKEFKEDLCLDLEPAAQELITNGLLESSGGFLRLTRKGIVVSNAVITELMLKLSL